MKPKRDAIAEQSLAATIRKCIELDIAIQFPHITEIGEGEDKVQIINPPVIFKFSRAVPGTDPPLRLAHATPFPSADLKDDKDLAIALALALRGFLMYEEAAKQRLPPDVTGGNGRSKIIMPGE